MAWKKATVEMISYIMQDYWKLLLVNSDSESSNLSP